MKGMKRHEPVSRRPRWLIRPLIILLLLSGCQTSVRMDEVAQNGSINEVGKIPAKSFFGNPLFSLVTLSPSGRRIAVLLSREENDVMMSIDLATGKNVPLMVLERKERSHSTAGQAISAAGWASEDVVVMSVTRPKLGPGFIRRQATLAASDVRDPRARDLGKDWPYARFLTRQDTVISMLPDDPDRLLVNWFGDARKVDIKFSRLRAAEFSKKGVGAWGVDHEFKVRIGYSGDRWTNDFAVWGRVSDDEPIEKLVKWNPLDEDEMGVGFYFSGFSEDPKTIYVLSERETGRYALYEYDMRIRKIGRTVFEHPDYEVGAIDTSNVDGRLLAVHYVDEMPRVKYLDAEYARLWEPIHRAFPGKNVQRVSVNRDETISIFTVSADDFPHVYYRLDHTKGEYSKLFRSRPSLGGQSLSKMESVSFQSRDGLEIHGYVTRPHGVDGPTATIVLPNRDVFDRDFREWNPVVQFFASRGFSVFQINQRGSIGYGRKFREAGYQEYGRAMQDDITDGTRWLIDQGIADPDRIGIFGSGYGGYVALQALVSTPDLFAAGASYGGISDLQKLLRDYQGYGFAIAWNEALIGKRWSDRESLRAASPVYHADQIVAPVLLGHGTHDWNHHIRHTDEMVSALEEAGVEHEVYRYRGESHGFLDERTRIDFFQRTGDFFERHLKPDAKNIRRPVEPADTGV